MYKRILVPLDSSKLADMVLPYAEVLAGALDSRLNLLYVSESEEKHYLRVHEFYLGKIAELVKSHIKENYPEKTAASIRVKSAVMAGKPAEEICDYISINKIELVILAGRGRSSIMRRLMGSIADRVFQETNVPLLLVTAQPPPVSRPWQLLDSILVPLDGSVGGEAALPYVIKLTQQLRAEVILTQVVTPLQQLRTTRRVEYVRFTEQQQGAMKTAAERYLENIRKKLTETKAIVHYEVRIADEPATEIASLANERDIKLIAIASRRYAGIRRLVSGSVAQKFTRATNKPILLVKIPG